MLGEVQWFGLTFRSGKVVDIQRVGYHSGGIFSKTECGRGCCGMFWKLLLISEVPALITEVTSLPEVTFLILTIMALQSLRSSAH